MWLAYESPKSGFRIQLEIHDSAFRFSGFKSSGCKGCIRLHLVSATLVLPQFVADAVAIPRACCIGIQHKLICREVVQEFPRHLEGFRWFFSGAYPSSRIVRICLREREGPFLRDVRLRDRRPKDLGGPIRNSLRAKRPAMPKDFRKYRHFAVWCGPGNDDSWYYCPTRKDWDRSAGDVVRHSTIPELFS